MVRQFHTCFFNVLRMSNRMNWLQSTLLALTWTSNCNFTYFFCRENDYAHFFWRNTISACFLVAKMIWAHLFCCKNDLHILFCRKNYLCTFFVTKRIYAHFFFVAKTIYALSPESFCALKVAIRKVQTFWASGFRES